MSRFKLVPLLFLIALASAAINQTPIISEGGITFTDSGQTLGNDFSTDVALGDLDGDGDQDAFVTNSATQNQVWINQGGEQGGTEGVFLDSSQPLDNFTQRGLALGDLDGDLDLDAFIVRGIATDSLQVWINQGGAQGGTPGIFQRNAFTVNDDLATGVVLGDVDGDMDLDAYLPHIFDADLIYLNDGSGLFTNSGQSLEAADSLGVDLADLDNDDDLDAFVAVENGANTVWLNQGGVQGGTEGIFLNSGQTLGSASSLAVALGDLDNDNDIDAYVANATENVVWINQGGVQGGTLGVFQFNGQLLGFSASVDVKLADLDNDNDLDAFVAEFGPNTVWVNQGGNQGGMIGQFADSGLSLGNQTSNGVALADVDGDNDIDAFVANSGPSPNRVYLNGSGPSQPPVNPEGWQVQLVDTRGEAGYSPAIAFDSQGYPHIAQVVYVQHPNGSSNRLYHMYWDGIRWHKDQVASAGAIGKKISIALDSNDNPHIAFAALSDPNMGLRYAYWNGTDWQMQAIESDDFLANISLALDTLDRPHVSYAISGAGGFKYAYWNGTTWHKETVETASSLSNGYTSLALDANNRPHIVYFNDDAEQLKYAHYDGNTWLLNTIEANADFSAFDHFFSLTLSNTMPVVAYYKDSGETLIYAQWNGSVWQPQTVLTLNFPQSLTGNISLALDSTGNPHIAYAYYNNSTRIDLYYIFWDGAQWQNTILDTGGALGQRLDMALDANDKPHIAYQDRTFGDLRYTSWDKNWQIRTVTNQAAAVDIQVQELMPYLSYHSSGNDLVSVTHWDDNWQTTAADNVANPIPQISLSLTLNGQYISYYDADAQTLRFGRHTSSSWETRVVDDQGNVGRYNQLILPGNQSALAHIAYWDETNGRIKLAAYQALSDTFALHANTAAPTLASGSGPLSASFLADGDIGIAYYDAGSAGLRFATWNIETEIWTDELVDNDGGDMGRLNSVQTDEICGCPAVAYYDETNDLIKYAQKIDGTWLKEIVTPNAGGVSGLSLELGLDSRLRPRLTYLTANTAHFALKENGSWQFEIIADGVSNPTSTALALDVRPHIAYPDALNGMQYVFRTATLDVDTMVPGPPIETGMAHNSFTPCGMVIDFFFEFVSAPSLTDGNFRLPFGGETSLDDDGVFEGMAMLFSQTNDGQYYIETYFDNAPEMAQIGLNDPQLLWDGYGTLQNFLPGLEAFVTGHGDEFVVTQQMVDDALDIWTRIAAVASPQLANAINTELAQSNNLQDFVGLSFDEWALAIGVNPPTDNIYLPAVFR